MKAVEVILLESIPRLGEGGERVFVRAGFARNFLLPKGKALRANQASLTFFEQCREEIEARNLEARKKAEKASEALKGFVVDVIRQAGDRGQLYGSVSGRDLVIQLGEMGYHIDRSQIDLARPIKTLGLHPLGLRLHPEIRVVITANVARSEEEAKTQRKLGRAVVGNQENEIDESSSLESDLPSPEAHNSDKNRADE